MTRLIFLALFAATAAAQNAPPIARYVPPTPDGAHVFVMDSAHILSAPTIAALQDSAAALQAATHADVAWVTLPTLGRRAIEEAALYIGRTWHVGPAGEAGDPLRNRGLVILYVPDKTKTAGSNFRVEVGNGLEGTITDSRSRTITQAMRDDLRAKRYDDAYMKGWAVAAALVREDFASHNVTTAPRAAAGPLVRHDKGVNWPAIAIVLAILAFVGFFIIRSMIRAMRQPRMKFRSRNETAEETSEERLKRAGLWILLNSMSSGSSSSSSSSGSDFGGSSDSGSSGGGDFGGGGGFSGGGSSDSI